MSEKEYCAVESASCPICGTVHDTGVLLNRRLKPTFSTRSVTTHIELCPEHKEKLDEGFTALVGIDESKSAPLANGNFNPEGAYRTGTFVLMRDHLVVRLLDTKIPDGKLFYCEEEVLRQLESLQPTEESS